MAALQVEGLAVAIAGTRRDFTAVTDVSFRLEQGRTAGLVGESGCGKSLLALALLGLLPEEGRITAGSIRLGDVELVGLTPDKLRQVRGDRMAMIFQEPMSSLNPVMRIGDQIIEALHCHERISRAAARDRAESLLRQVRIPDARQRMATFPHEMSGGMLQRVMIAMALSCEPEVLVADEPTTALDVTVQGQVLALLYELQSELKMAMLLITHDLGLIGQGCDDLMVMYRGRIIEAGPAEGTLAAPRHPYTAGLLACTPSVDASSAAGMLTSIKGSLPALEETIAGCAYHPRCPQAQQLCAEKAPVLEKAVRCHFPLREAVATAASATEQP